MTRKRPGKSISHHATVWSEDPSERVALKVLKKSLAHGWADEADS